MLYHIYLYIHKYQVNEQEFGLRQGTSLCRIAFLIASERMYGALDIKVLTVLAVVLDLLEKLEFRMRISSMRRYR